VRRTVVVLVLLVAVGCGSHETPTSRPTNASSAPSSALPALVGQWQLTQTCAGLVRAMRRVHRLDLLSHQLGDFVGGWEEGPPAGWDPRRPCAHAAPARTHSHTFWADGTFNSYDENGAEVDADTYELVNDHTFRFSPLLTVNYRVTGELFTMDPVPPENCTGERIVGVEDGRSVSCLEVLAWAYSVAWPGAQWKRVTSGPHVPPGSGSSH